jgi:hypothetical protein
VRVAILVPSAAAKRDLLGPFKKTLQLLERDQPLFAHLDHHAPDDRPIRITSDSYLGGNAPPVQTHTIVDKTVYVHELDGERQDAEVQEYGLGVKA